MISDRIVKVYSAVVFSGNNCMINTFYFFEACMQHLPSAIVRYSLTLMFLWFGVQQVVESSAWIGFLPTWTSALPLSAEQFVQINGLLEIVLAFLLGVGIYTRFAAIVLGLHLLGIAISVGDAIGVRDAALAMCTLALAVGAPDIYTLDVQRKNR
jgi:uncharacterized membrane protein YphA (DoxX/SURF4 family)